jgi:RecA-family ATPase
MSVINNEEYNNSLFEFKPANQWLDDASKLKEQKKLFGDFWREGELAILFADTGIGKSILSVQIADSISKGEATLGLEFKADKQKVLYFDFENSEIQFKKRYTNIQNKTYRFDDYFLRVTFNSEYNYNNEKHVDSIFSNIEKCVIESTAKVVIIDNMTYLNGDIEKANEASSFIKKMRELRKKYELSILVISHTPKRYETKPIDVNDLCGSKMISNLVDSIFAIGASKKGNSTRYLKQIKCRSGEIVYNTDNIISCQIVQNTSKLMFEFNEFGDEHDHLQPVDKEELKNKAKALKAQGMNNVQIGNLLNVTEGTIRNWVK